MTGYNQGYLKRHQRNLCYLCGEAMLRRRRKHPKRLWVTVDHIEPLSLGGGNVLGNVAMAHKDCNSRKSNRRPSGCERLFGAVLALIESGRKSSGTSSCADIG